MVYEINMEQVDINDRLSNQVYHYDKDLRTLDLQQTQWQESWCGGPWCKRKHRKRWKIVIVDYEKKLKEVIKIKISNLNQDEEFVIKVEVVTDGKDKAGIN